MKKISYKELSTKTTAIQSPHTSAVSVVFQNSSQKAESPSSITPSFRRVTNELNTVLLCDAPIVIFHRRQPTEKYYKI